MVHLVFALVAVVISVNFRDMAISPVCMTSIDNVLALSRSENPTHAHEWYWLATFIKMSVHSNVQKPLDHIRYFILSAAKQNWQQWIVAVTDYLSASAFLRKA
jgi:hypothetical protein